MVLVAVLVRSYIDGNAKTSTRSDPRHFELIYVRLPYCVCVEAMSRVRSTQAAVIGKMRVCSWSITHMESGRLPCGSVVP